MTFLESLTTPALREEIERLLKVERCLDGKGEMNSLYIDIGNDDAREVIEDFLALIDREKKKAVEDALWKFHHGESKNADDVSKHIVDLFPPISNDL